VFDTRIAPTRNARLQKSKEQVSRVTRLLSIIESVGEFKTTFSKFHTIVLRLVGIKVHGDMLSNAMMWREVEAVASKGEYSTGLWV
jgi:hypothetical protein